MQGFIQKTITPKKKGKSLLSLSTILASFFGAAMIAMAFAYFNYKFSEYKFIKSALFKDDFALFHMIWTLFDHYPGSC